MIRRITRPPAGAGLLAWLALAPLLAFGQGDSKDPGPITASPGYSGQPAGHGGTRDPLPDHPSPRQGGETPETAPLLSGWPLWITGTTEGFDDTLSPACPEPATGPDVYYRLEPALSQSFAFESCGSSYPVRLALYQDTVDGPHLLDCDGSGCAQGGGRLQAQLAAGGVYYLALDGAAGQQGEYRLLVWNPCGAAAPLACGSQVAVQDSVSANAWQDYCVAGETGPELVYSVTHPGGLLEAHLQGFNDQDHDLILLADCDPGSCLQMPFEGDSDEILSNALPAGDYLLAVDLWNWSGEGQPGQGLDFLLTLECDPFPCAGLPLLECTGPFEHEPNGGWEDNQQADTIACGDTLCGSFWADGGLRDLDWVRLDHPGGPLDARLETVQSNAVLYLTTEVPPEQGGRTLRTVDEQRFCGGEHLQLEYLEPGAYFLVVGHNAFLGVPQDEPWRLTVACPEDPCLAHTPVDCADGLPEQEPNEGWNSNNQNWNETQPGLTRCGTLSAQNGLRDTDWYRFELEDSAAVALACRVDELDPILFLFTAALPPSGRLIAGSDNFGRCQPESLFVAALPPGSYYAMIAHNATQGVPVPQAYTLELHTLPLPAQPDPCADLPLIVLDAQPQSLQLPAPTLDGFDGGPACDGVVSGGMDHRITLDLAVGGEWVITATGQGERADEVLFLLEGCGPEAVCLQASDSQGPGPGGETLQTGPLAAGVYTLVLDFWGSLESHPVMLEIQNLLAVSDIRTRPETLSLACHPNPFNPRTTLEWNHPGGPAAVSVYDILGRRVLRQLLPDTGPGLSHWTLDGGGLAGGIYLVEVSTGAGTAGRTKVLLLK